MSFSILRKNPRLITFTGLVCGVFALSACNPETVRLANTEPEAAPAPAYTPSNPSRLPDHLLPPPLLQCLSETASIVGLADTQIKLSNSARVRGSVVLMGNSTIRMTNSARILENLFLRSPSQLTTTNIARAENIVQMDLSSAEPHVMEFAENLDALDATQAIPSSWNMKSRTIMGNGKLNVIDINGDLNLFTNAKWTLKGSDHDLFLLRVKGNMMVTNSAQLVVEGGVLPRHVLIYLQGDHSSVQLSNSAKVVGTLLVPHGPVDMSNSVSLYGSIIARNQIKLSNSSGTFDPAPFCPTKWSNHPVPEPTSSETPVPEPTATQTPDPEPTQEPSPEPSPEPTSTQSPDPEPTQDPEPDPSNTPVPVPTVIEPCSDDSCVGPVIGM